MVIVRLMGGLGNQMFQAAAGRRLAARHGVELRFDRTFLEDRTPRPDFVHRDYALDVFALQVESATDRDTWLYRPHPPERLTGPLLRRWRERLGGRLLTDDGLTFQPAALDAPARCYLAGYWQSERYFADAADRIRADFRFREPMDADNRAVAERMAAVNAVSLHVRRGDYANPTNAQIYAVCGLDYYRAAVALLCERLTEPVFFVFSDDMDWARDNLPPGHAVEFVDINRGERSSQDMRLMSLCRHHIIANSTFSWWGAWLNPSPDKIVIAPGQWFRDPARDRDLIPAGWIRV